MSWKERLVELPDLWDMANWPAIPLDSLSPKRRKIFLRNQRAVAQVLAGSSVAQTAVKHQLSPGRLSQVLARCLGGNAAAAPALTKGLIPYCVTTHRHRVSPLPLLQSPGGSATAFQHLLETVPGLREGLDAMIEAKLKDKAYAQRPTPQAMHQEFKRLLAEQHWPQDRYPYTTVSIAYESVRRYLNTRTAELMAERQQRRLKPSRNLGLQIPGFRAQRATQIDEHTLDLQDRIHLQLDNQLIPLRLGRASVLVAVDVDTMCRLGYYLVPTRHPNQQDMLALIERCLLPWQPLPLATPGITYTQGACFPSGGSGAFPISFGTVQFDNALMHHALSVGDLLAQQMGSTLSFGLPAMPEVRHRVESVFDYISKHFTHRVASTSGSHPTDPIRESRKNRKKPPLITIQTLDEALSVLLTEDNVTPRAALGGATPLALYQEQCASHFVRYAPPWLTQQWQPFISSKEVSLHWYHKESRFPHVYFAYERYQGASLMGVADTIKHIRVVFDRRDIRTLQAYTLEGEALGELLAPRSWQRFPHSLATRNHIHRHTKSLRIGMRDPLGNYFRHLLDHRGKPEVALSLLRVYTEFTAGQTGGLHLEMEPVPVVDASRARGVYSWHSGLANHRD